MALELETVTLRTCVIVRPAHSCGTMGWSPKAWQCATVRRGQNAVDAFLQENTNWKHHEVSGVVRPAAI
jgi:hypothetical protein